MSWLDIGGKLRGLNGGLYVYAVVFIVVVNLIKAAMPQSYNLYFIHTLFI